MDDAHDAEPDGSPYIRLPWALVAAALAGVLLLALGIGLYANRYLRPQLGVASPTPIALAAAAEPPTPPPSTVAVPAPTRAPTPIATIVVDAPTQPPATAPPATTPQPSTSLPATSEPTPPVAAPTLVATPRPTVSPELAAEIGDAYQEYWRVRAEALYDLDTSHLPEVMAGDHLAAVEDRINELHAEGRAIETEVEHHYAVFEASAEDAKIADSYADMSVYVDVQTHAPVSTATGEKLNEVYIMNKIDGTWRVITLVRDP